MEATDTGSTPAVQACSTPLIPGRVRNPCFMRSKYSSYCTWCAVRAAEEGRVQVRADEWFCALKCSSRCSVCKWMAELLLLPALCVGQACVLGDKRVNLHRPYSISVHHLCVRVLRYGKHQSCQRGCRQQLRLEVLPVLGRGRLVHGAAHLLHSGLILGWEIDVELPGFYPFSGLFLQTFYSDITIWVPKRIIARLGVAGFYFY